MMIVELIDEIDLIEKLKACGVPLKSDESLAENLDAVIAWCEADSAQSALVEAQFSTLEKGEITLLPEVQQFIDQIRETTHAG